MFLVLLLLPLVVYLHQRRGFTGALRFSATGDVKRAGASIRQNLTPLLLVIRVLTLLALGIALARPQMGTEQVRDVRTGRAPFRSDRDGDFRALCRYRVSADAGA